MRASNALLLLGLLTLACDDDDDNAADGSAISDAAPNDAAGDAAPNDATPTDGAADLDSGPRPDGTAHDAALPPDDGVYPDATPDVSIPDPPDDVTPANWAEEFSAGFCSVVARCRWPGLPHDAALCRAQVSADLFNGHYLPEAVTAGHLAFDSAAGERCLDGLAALSCEALFTHLTQSFETPVADCAQVWDGQVAEGGDCSLGYECQTGLRCRVTDSCPGTCQATVAPGSACTNDNECAGLAWCISGQCQRLPTEGEPCLEGVICAPPFSCTYNTATCERPRLVGESCAFEEDRSCLAGLVCFGEQCAQLGRVGEPCQNYSQCEAGLVCAGGTCDPAPSAEEPCMEFRCGQAAWCDTAAVPATCTALPEVGEPCANETLCEPNAYCDAGLCVLRKAAGEACLSPSECADGNCFLSRCIAEGEPGCQP